MKLLIPFMLLAFSAHTQIQSDTGTVFINGRDSIQLRGAFGGARIYIKQVNGNWEWKTLYFDEKDQNGKINIHTKKPVNTIHSFMPYGGLISKDSIYYMVGMLSTFQYQGVILRSNNKGKDWKIYICDAFNSSLKARGLSFITNEIGFAFYGNQDVLGVSINNGKDWLTYAYKDGEIKVEKNNVRIEAKTFKINGLFGGVEGKYSMDKGETWIDFKAKSY
ncbi:hypothetical protein DNU06_06875 [Putridiphycobacter roseus]|uniref:Uncharacterized protein n=1 Tax=Putridiphycobacter roseus TaxID=2219161 RepID=A0A2W1NDP7_9FLAO|nr:hypothetical protein [Putridiphycobacter roseus]PZE17545.1 hypothetical protein DNU06_06875 [Putridiphycobacter roseus]